MRSEKSRQAIKLAVLFVLLLGVDILTKTAAEAQGLVIQNQGGVGGILPGKGWIITIVIVLGLIIWGLWRKATSVWQQTGMILLLAGGVGNLWDRISLGHVRDFIYYPVGRFYGNAADVFLVIGVACLFWDEWKRSKL